MQNGRILAVKRGASKNAEVAYKYEFVGGKIEEGESPEAALKREALEEMDYSIEIVDPFMRSVYEYKDVIVDLMTFICKPLSQSFVLNEHGRQQVAFARRVVFRRMGLPRTEIFYRR